MSYGENMKIIPEPKTYIFINPCGWFTCGIKKGYFIIENELVTENKERLWINISDDKVTKLLNQGFIRLITPYDNSVNHPAHYGGEDNSYEAIKVIEAWELGFNLGNAVKYISRAGKKDKEQTLTDLKKALWYLDRHIKNLEK